MDNRLLQICLQLCCGLTVRIRIVADFVTLSCQVTRKLKRATTLEFTTISAIIIIHPKFTFNYFISELNERMKF